ncbi:MAG TPA: hypothetical protein VFN57_18065 [Thermomicrobiaceae bacterium]|nr:hypothetical protein [Thermomicrobiaceae bacterium]
MHIRITRSHFDPSRATEVRPFGPEVAAIVRRLPGCRHCSNGIAEAAGQTITISIFDTAEQADFSREVFGDLLARFADLGLRFDPPEVYEEVG